MSECKHDLAERETMCADGFCPVCFIDERDKLKAELESYKFQTKHAVDIWKSRAEKAEAIAGRLAETLKKISEDKIRIEYRNLDHAVYEESNTAKIAKDALAAYAKEQSQRRGGEMKFTDDDLARWKKDLAKVTDPYAFPDVKALIHRLECAEACIPHVYANRERYMALEKWRKAKGEGSDSDQSAGREG